MTNPVPTQAYPIAEGEKVVPVMVYTASALVRGNVITKEAVRVSTWLRTQAAPEYIHFYHAQILLISGTGPIQNLTFPEFFLPASHVIAYHILPPTSEPVDYDPSEPNRKMEPVTAIFGGFRINGHIRMATQSNLARYVETLRDLFISIYDSDVSNPSISGMGVIHAPLILARTNCLSLANRV